MATQLHFSHQKPSLTDPTTIACYTLAIQTFDSVLSFDPPSWQRRLDAEGAMLFTASSSLDPNTPSTPAENNIHGFLLTSLRQHPELPSPTFHISLAAVDLSYRGLRIFPRLLAMAEEYCRDELSLGSVTICTLPESFPGMWRLLSDERNGWVEIGWRETGDGRQILMRRGV
jgi:ribosomal protein S18 acetylase RimI-like enzyme